ncbi:MAG: ribonuclease P protein component [Bacilli bacterium]
MDLKSRIKRTQEFKEIVENRRFVRTNSSIVYYKNQKLDAPRFGISVSKKVGNAVIRNKTKRRYRAIINSIKSEGIKFDFIVIAKPLINNLTYKDIENDVIGAIDKIREKINEQKA